MATFQYSAQNSSGKVINGTVEATTREGAVAALTNQQLHPISISEANKKGMKFSIGGGKVKSTDLVIFTRQLSTMVSAGVPLMRALTTLTEQSESEKLKVVLEQVTKDIQSGMSLGDAFGKHPKVFGDVYVNMVRAGEAGGILDDILKRLAMQQEKSDSMRKKIKSAMTYPVVLIVITILAFFGMMLFVIPQIGKILLDLGGPNAELPAITKAMLGISSFMINYWYICIGGIIGLIVLAKWYLATPQGKSQYHHLVLKMPGVGPIIKKIAVARFARTYASLIGAGVSLVEALRVTGDAIGNEVYKEALTKAVEEVKGGKQLSGALAQANVFPAIVPQMLAVGEETGQTDIILVKVADFYEEEVDASIEGISSVIEPVMIVVMGGLVGLIAVSVMGPIASLSQNVQ